MFYKRKLQNVIEKHLHKGKVVVLYGARQVGKTTLVRGIVEQSGKRYRFVDCELLENKALLERRNTADLFSLVEGYEIIVFDEAQVVRDIGQVLKSIHDHRPQVQLIATGSSSFDLANLVSEPLTGRSYEFTLFPLAIAEMTDNQFDASQKLPDIMRFGAYPDIESGTENERIQKLKTLVSQYIYKNVLAIGGIRKPEIILNLLRLLAHQIGNEVSLREIAGHLGTSPATVDRYIDLLEKNFIIIRVSGFGSNMRNEVTRTKKIYFVDLGVRNALIDAFAPIEGTARGDVGPLFENAFIIERRKHLGNSENQTIEGHFWRSVSQQEVDYIERDGTALVAYECKWSDTKIPQPPPQFARSYPQARFEYVHRNNFFGFVAISTG
ncbi:ATP-binding protein [Candidatus Kaiserbacteria bacterium]|nr:ATP-binding protein [Candidatus Kaiserbacteria bacterium]